MISLYEPDSSYNEILLANVAVELLEYSVQFLHRNFFQSSLLAWLLRIPTFKSSYPCVCRTGRVFIPVLLLQFFNFAVNNTRAGTWLRFVADLFNDISRNTTQYSVNFVFATGGKLVFAIVQEIEDRIPENLRSRQTSHLQ